MTILPALRHNDYNYFVTNNGFVFWGKYAGHNFIMIVEWLANIEAPIIEFSHPTLPEVIRNIIKDAICRYEQLL